MGEGRSRGDRARVDPVPEPPPATGQRRGLRGLASRLGKWRRAWKAEWQAGLRRLPFFTQRTAVVLIGAFFAALAFIGAALFLPLPDDNPDARRDGATSTTSAGPVRTSPPGQ